MNRRPHVRDPRPGAPKRFPESFLGAIGIGTMLKAMIQLKRRFPPLMVRMKDGDVIVHHPPIPEGTAAVDDPMEWIVRFKRIWPTMTIRRNADRSLDVVIPKKEQR